MRTTIKVGTRGSVLALRQADEVILALSKQRKDLTFEKVIVETPGDAEQDAPIASVPGKGRFTRTIEDRLLAATIDLAVHSAKDLPAELPEGLVIGAVPGREDPRDVLIAAGNRGLEFSVE